MKRLLEDAQALQEAHGKIVEYSIGSFSDIVEAIHVIQDEWKITGTTVDEAGRTIQGSAAAMRAAWENLLTAMADPEGSHDLGAMVQNFVDTAITSVDNMIPSIEAAILGISDVVEQLAPVVEEKIQPLIDKIAPSVIQAVSTLMNVVLTVIANNMPLIISTVIDSIDTLWDNIDGQTKAIVSIIGGAWAAIKAIGIASGILRIIELLGGTGGLQAAMTSVSTFATSTLTTAFTTASTSITTAFTTAFTTLQTQITAFGTQAVSILNGTAAAAQIAAAEIAVAAVAIMSIIKVADELNTIASGLNAQTKNEDDAEATIQHFQETLVALDEMPVSVEKYEKLGETLDEVKRSREEWARVYSETNTRIAELEGKVFKTADETAELKRLQQERDSLDAEYASLVLYQEKIENQLATYSDELVDEINREAEQEGAALARKRSVYEGANAGFYAEAEKLRQQNEENAKKTSTGNLGLDNIVEKYVAELDHSLAIHEITTEQYYAKKKEILDRFHNEESETWNKHYDDVNAYYEKEAETERKAAERAAKQREQERQKREAAQEKARKETERRERERQQAENERVQKAFRALEQTMLDNGLGEEWLIKQERMYIETLDHESELYQEYNVKVSKEEKKLAEKAAAERKKAAEETKKSFTDMVDDMIKNAKSKIAEYEKAVEKIKEEIKSFGESLRGSFKEAFSFDADKETGKMVATKNKSYITNMVDDLKSYYENIALLRDMNISDTLLNELQGMSREEGLATTEYLLGLSAPQLNSLSAKWDEAGMWGEKVSGALYSDELESAEQQLDETRNTLLGEIKEAVNTNWTEFKDALGTLGNFNFEINGIQFQDFGELKDAIMSELGYDASRKEAGYAV